MAGWLESLMADYPLPHWTEDEACAYCSEDKLCRYGVEELVDKVAELCEATREDVAGWMHTTGVELQGVAVAELVEQFLMHKVWVEAFHRKLSKASAEFQQMCEAVMARRDEIEASYGAG